MDLSRGGHKRSGTAGILSAIMFFALIFTAGVGFFQAAANDQYTSANAYSQRLSLQELASSENLSLRAGYGTGSGGSFLWLIVNNTGGVDSSIESVFVSSLSGSLLSSSPSTGSSFLSTTSALNESLPITLDPGASTLAEGANIGILPSALTRCGTLTSAGCDGQTVYVSVLTKLGNIFSVSFPAHTLVTEKNLVDEGLLDEYEVTQTDDTVTEVTTVECVGCVSGSYEGGNILVLLLTATPSPVGQGATITVTATVWDYYAYSAGSVAVSLNATYTGSASVTPNIAPSSSPNYACGSISLIASGASGSVSCTFSAVEGSLGGGTVSFVGEAKACVETGSGTTSPCSAASPGTPAESAAAGSNPVQVGAPVSYGLWNPNFYGFYYTGCSSSATNCVTSPSCWEITQYCGAAVLSNSEKYVAVYVQVTNEGTYPLTLLDGSYIQSVSPNVEFDLFMACSGASASVCSFQGQSTGADYSGTSGTINPYGCADSAPSVPEDTVSGQNCITVQQGGTVTLMFVASAPDTTTFEWATSNPGGTGGGNAAILLDFAACTSALSVCNSGGGMYAAATQMLPFEGIVVP